MMMSTRHHVTEQISTRKHAMRSTCGLVMHCKSSAFFHRSHRVITASRYIRPGRAYSLLTIDDCLALGSHFYTFLHLQATLDTLVNEHFYTGRLFIKMPRPSAPNLLKEMMKVIYEWYVLHSNEDSLGKYFAFKSVLCQY